MATPLVSDEVWQQLDPRAGRLSRRDRYCLAIAAVVLLVLAGAGFVARESGVIRPRLSVDSDWSGSFDPAAHAFTQSARVTNAGWTAVELTVSGSASPGIRIVSANGLPIHLSAGRTTTITVHYLVTDCASVNQGFVPIVLRVGRWWGTASMRFTPSLAGPAGPAYSACHGA